MSGVIHFEINADDPGKIIDFYTSVFGWKIEKWEGGQEYWLIYPQGEEGIGGGIGRKDPAMTAESVINTIGVESVDACIRKIYQAGGEVVRPKMAIPGIGWLAYIRDIEGNLFGIMEADAQAK
ncbi:MAG: VOC family protein [Candidatus Cloacimonetes bacterium]|nr:VOC family protein [Candidatus Cloacimonadota bacterium]